MRAAFHLSQLVGIVIIPVSVLRQGKLGVTGKLTWLMGRYAAALTAGEIDYDTIQG